MAPYGHRVSGVGQSRAAVFSSRPQDVEVYQEGAWRAGSLLGWRHESDGSCQVWVRTGVGRAERASWTALDLLRLPEVASVARVSGGESGAGGRGAAVDAVLTGAVSALRAVPVPAPRRSVEPRSASSEPTAAMDLLPVCDVTGDTPTVVPAAAARPGGRRRAPEPATVDQAVLTPVAVPAGRHRAPVTDGGWAGGFGRHRAADTGVWPAIRDDEPPGAGESPRSAAPAGGVEEWADAHPLTRPMWLGGLAGQRAPQPRRGAPEGRLSRV